jgi:hypothetical protein
VAVANAAETKAGEAVAPLTPAIGPE